MSQTPLKPLTDAELDKMIEEHNKGGAFKQQIAVAQECWDAGIVVKKTCGHMAAMPEFHITIEQLALEKIKKLQAYYPSLEWLMYLEGEVSHEDNTVLVKDLVIPDSQSVTGVNVHDVEYGWNEGRAIIGVIHSHHGMGAFFSGTDDAYINQNHDVSIVVSTSQRSQIQSQVRVKAPCGDYVLSEKDAITYKIDTEYEPILVDDEFEKEFSAKISTYTPPIIRYIGGLGNYFGGGNFGGGNFGGGNTYGGRGYANPPRQSTAFRPTTDPYSMSAEEVRAELLKYYSTEETDEFVANGEAQEELIIIQNLESQGVTLARYTDDNLTDDEISVWQDLEDEHEQNGMHQVSMGVPLGQQDGDETVWELTEEDAIDEEVDETPEQKTGTGASLH